VRLFGAMAPAQWDAIVLGGLRAMLRRWYEQRCPRGTRRVGQLQVYKVPRPLSLRIGDGSRIAEIAFGGGSLTISITGIHLRDLLRVSDAVSIEFGRKPTHFLAGWSTALELQCVFPQISVGEGTRLEFDGIPISVNPSEEHGIVAVPPLDVLVGRELPPDAYWRPAI
jgi:hypothetical protein